MKYTAANVVHDRGFSRADDRAHVERTAPARVRNLPDIYATLTELPTHVTINSISTRYGKGLVTDGPFAETRELLGG